MSFLSRLFSFFRVVKIMNNFLERLVVDLMSKVTILGTKVISLEESINSMVAENKKQSEELSKLQTAYDELLSFILEK